MNVNTIQSSNIKQSKRNIPNIASNSTPVDLKNISDKKVFSSLSFLGTINKAMLSKSNISFKGNGDWLNKDIWESHTPKEQKTYLKTVNLAPFGLNDDKYPHIEKIIEEIYSPDWETVKRRAEFTKDFPGGHKRTVDVDIDMYGSRVDIKRYFPNVYYVSNAFCDNPKEEIKRQEFALYLQNRLHSAEETGKFLNFAIIDNKLNDDCTDYVKQYINNPNVLFSPSKDKLKYLQQNGFTIKDYLRIYDKHVNQEELSEDEKDYLADLYLQSEAQNYKYMDVLKPFKDINLKDRIKSVPFIEHDNGTTGTIVKSKFSTYYVVHNGTETDYLTDEKEQDYINRYSDKVRSCRHLAEQNAQHLATVGKYHYPYYIEFPVGEWQQAVTTTENGISDIYFSEYIKSQNDYDKPQISILGDQTIYYKKQ